MLKVINVLCFVLVLNVNLANGFLGSSHRHTLEYMENDDVGEPLILTPFIEEGKLEEARSAAKVVLEGAEKISSYSGYLTVDEEHNSNLFFWFFESMNNASSDPVLLWIQGNEGRSSLFGLFIEHGPFRISSGNELIFRHFTWINSHSIIYMDTPAGCGLSFTNNTHPSDIIKAGKETHHALLQFFKLFPEFQKNDFFIAGEDYGGKTVPVLGTLINMMYDPNGTVNINLKGMAIANPFSDPINQCVIGDFLYELGMIDNKQRSIYLQMEQDVIDRITAEDYKGAYFLMRFLQILLERFTYISDQFNSVYNSEEIEHQKELYEIYINQPNIRRALHIGNTKLDEKIPDGYFDCQSVAPNIDHLLTEYRIMFFTGQMNVLVNIAAVNKFLQNLAYDNETKINDNMYIRGQFVGPFSVVGNLINILVRGAGNVIPFEKPRWAFEIITNFTRNTFDLHI